MRPSEYYISLHKYANKLTAAQGLWKGTVAGALPGAVIGGYKGSQDNPDNATGGALTGAVVGATVGGLAGRGLQYGSRVHRIAAELKAQGKTKSYFDGLGDAFAAERDVASRAGKDGYSAAVKRDVAEGRVHGAGQRQITEILAEGKTNTAPVKPNYWADARALGATIGGAALAGGAAEAAFGDKNKSFSARFGEGALHGGLGGALIGGSNLGLKHLTRHLANSEKPGVLRDTARHMESLYNSKFYREREGSTANAFAAGSKKGLAIGLGMDTVSGMGTPDRNKQAAAAVYADRIREQERRNRKARLIAGAAGVAGLGTLALLASKRSLGEATLETAGDLGMRLLLSH